MCRQRTLSRFSPITLGSIGVIRTPRLLLHQAEHHQTFRMLKQNCLCLLLHKMEENDTENQPRHRTTEQPQLVPTLPELKKHLENMLRHVVGFSGCLVQDQDFESMILVDPFQLRIFYNCKSVEKTISIKLANRYISHSFTCECC